MPKGKLLEPAGAVSLQSFSSMDTHQEEQMTGESPGPPPAALAQKAEALSLSLSLPLDQVQRLLIRNPASLALPLPELCSFVTTLSNSSPLTLLQALAMTVRRPSLLSLSQTPPDSVPLLFSSIASTMSLPLDDALPLIARQPALLEIPSDLLASQAPRLASALEVTLPALLLLLSRVSSHSLKSLLSSSAQSTRDQVAELKGCVALRVGPSKVGDTMMLITKWPGLLMTPVKDVDGALEKLPGLLKIPQRRLMTVLLRVPGLLVIPPASLLSNHRGIAASLPGLDAPSLAQMLLKEPRLLQLDPPIFKERVQGMMYRLYLHPKQVLLMVQRQPQLLLYSSATLQQHLEQIMRLLSVSHTVAAAMVRQHPNLLGFRPDTIQAKLHLLNTAFFLPPARVRELVTLHPILLTLSPTRLSSSASLLMEGMRVLETKVGELVIRWPILLLETPATVWNKILDLASLLLLSEEAAGRLVARNPSFLFQDPRHWQTNLDTLTSQLTLTISQARQVILASPSLLSLPPRHLLNICQFWVGAFKAAPHWRHEVEGGGEKGSMPQGVGGGIKKRRVRGGIADRDIKKECEGMARVLTFRWYALQHVQYLLDAGQAGRQPLLADPLLESRANFVARYPDFQRWVQSQRASPTHQLWGAERVGGAREERQPALERRRSGMGSNAWGGQSSQGQVELADMSTEALSRAAASLMGRGIRSQEGRGARAMSRGRGTEDEILSPPELPRGRTVANVRLGSRVSEAGRSPGDLKEERTGGGVEKEEEEGSEGEGGSQMRFLNGNRGGQSRGVNEAGSSSQADEQGGT